jgi:polysaccharide export outer membrane protein
MLRILFLVTILFSALSVSASSVAQLPASYVSPSAVPWDSIGGHQNAQPRSGQDPNAVYMQEQKRYLQARSNLQQQSNSVQPQQHYQPSYPGQAYATPYNQARAPQPSAQKSALENLYSGRIVDELSQYGYDLFGVPSNDTRRALSTAPLYQQQYPDPSLTRMTPMGAVQDDFILNSGDQVEVMFTGQRAERKIYTITPQGTLLVDDFPPIPAAGRTIGQVRISLEAGAVNLYNTQAYISLAAVSQIGVLVVGHVKKPGRQNLTVFNSALDALMQAGGVQKTGSLRKIKLVRGGRSTLIDLYDLLMNGQGTADLRVRNGDRIIVPAIGPSVAIAGEVKRPGIYEITSSLTGMHHKAQDGIEKLSLNDMLDLGGGVLAPGQNRMMKIEIRSNGKERVSDVTDPFTPQFGNGSILMISKGQDKRSGVVTLSGHTRKAGMHALSTYKTLRKLISGDQVLGADIYPLIGIIERRNPETLSTEMIDFPLRLVLQKKFDLTLKDEDVVHLFSNTQIAELQDNSKDDESRLYAYEMGSRAQEDEDRLVLRDNPKLASYLTERSVSLQGAARVPGHYPASEGTTLASVIAVAGGLTLEANTKNIEITSSLNGESGARDVNRTTVSFDDTNPDNVKVEAGDSIRVNHSLRKLKSNMVTIKGEVKSPGEYDLLPGDKLSDLMARAGGVTEQSYADGTIFSRASERKAEEMRFKASARELERAIAAAIQQGETGKSKSAPDVQKIALTRDLANELREVESVGRITVEADPDILRLQPELDILLEDGDIIHIPRRPLTVRVSGEVLSPASLQFRQGKDPLDYVNQAGGFTFNADTDRTFVLYPDGSAQPLQVSAWNHSSTMIPPGSTIVVPRDPKPFDFIQSAKDVSQILSNLAVTGIFVRDLRDDE